MRLSLEPTNPTVGDLEGNAREIVARARAAHAAGVRLMVLPELAICSYPPRDLLLDGHFVSHCEQAADAIARELPAGLAMVVGLPVHTAAGRELTSGPRASFGELTIANALRVYDAGRRIATYHKRLLPNYDVFDEQRYFRPGESATVAVIDGVRVGLSICEDLWRGDDAREGGRYGRINPLADLVAAGAQLVVSPSASPFVMGKDALHRQVLETQAQRCGVAIAAVNQHGGNDDLIFDGHTRCVSRDGRSVAAGPLFSGQSLVIDFEPPTGFTPPADPAANEAAASGIDRDDELWQLWAALTLGIRDYVTKSGFSRVAVGLSGGIDSALTAVLAAGAVGARQVIGVRMPSAISSDHSLADAQDLAQRLGLTLVTVPIESPRGQLTAVTADALGSLGQTPLGTSRPDVANENLQSRLRGTIMMAISNRTNALVLTTGNKSEYAVGYATLYGDMNGALAPLIDVPKTRVWQLSRWINAHARTLALPHDQPIPPRSIEKAPSAELAEGQLDTDSLPPYALLDQIIQRRVDDRAPVDEIVRELAGASSDGRTLDEAEVRRVCRMIQFCEYKRYQAAVGLKTSPKAFGPGRRFPVVSKRTGW